MNSRERFVAAIRNQVPDRVPVAPDISNYVPAKSTGLPFWDIYFFNQVPLWRAYLAMVDQFGFDAWNASSYGVGGTPVNPDYTEKVSYDYRSGDNAMVKTTVWHTPDGDLTGKSLCFRGDPPSPVEKPIRDIVRDFPKYRHLIAGEMKFDFTEAFAVRAEYEKREMAFGLNIGYPGFHNFAGVLAGGLTDLVYAEADTPEILEEWAEIIHHQCIAQLQATLSTIPVDYMLLGGSGTLTLSSPEMVRKYALPTLREMTRLCREAGVPTMLHSCGKSLALLEILAEETELDCINPLEIPPMGDVILADVKARYGKRLALMGNLHTTNVMLKGSAAEVTAAARRAMADAGAGGGFILSTGDQCGPETPDENLFAIVEAAKQFGVYDAAGQLPQCGA
ncbi:MAG: uroporphyrinogen decarboxylase family protein [Victivallaceae bacterium]